MKYSLTFIELLTIVVFIGIVLMMNLPMKGNEKNLLAQKHTVVEKNHLMCPNNIEQSERC